MRLTTATETKNARTGRSEGLREKESCFNLSWDPEEMAEREAEIVVQREGKSFRGQQESSSRGVT